MGYAAYHRHEPPEGGLLGLERETLCPETVPLG